MTNDTPLIPETPPVAKKKLPRWPFFLGGGILLFFILIIVAIVIVVTLIAGGTSGPRDTVLRFDRAYEKSDCAALEATTTADLRDQFIDGGYTCDQWISQIAGPLTVDGDYTVDVEVTKTTVNGDTATVLTTEEYDHEDTDDEVVDIVYDLERQDGRWVIVNFSAADE